MNDPRCIFPGLCERRLASRRASLPQALGLEQRFSLGTGENSGSHQEVLRTHCSRPPAPLDLHAVGLQTAPQWAEQLLSHVPVIFLDTIAVNYMGYIFMNHTL